MIAVFEESALKEVVSVSQVILDRIVLSHIVKIIAMDKENVLRKN